MPVDYDGVTYLRTADVCREAGISRSTLLRWLKQGVLEKPYRDRKGWRVFTLDDLKKIRAEASRLHIGERP
ncbi:MerR family transcriptional regulator [Chloroflexota bacterium]